MIKEYNILISSVGGQGGITLTRILSNAALSQGLKVLVSETHGMAQRGGSVQSHIRLGEDVYSPLIPKGKCDALLSLEPAESLRVLRYIGKNTSIIMNTIPILSISVLLNETMYPRIGQIIEILSKLGGGVYPIDALYLSKKAGSSRSLNMVVLGAYMSLGDDIFEREAINEALTSLLPSQYLEQNKKALKLGMNIMQELI